MATRLIGLALLAQALFRLSASQINPETGAFFLREYSPRAYRGAPQNWAITQDHRGVIYVGNTDGILEFDGQRWRKIRLPNSSTVRSLAVDAQGTVYVGGEGELGFLKPDHTGTLAYISLLNQIDSRDLGFGDIWTILPTSSGVVFSATQRLFRWSRTRGMQVWRPASTFTAAHIVDGTPYLIKVGTGLVRLTGDSLEPVPGGNAFSQTDALRAAFRFAGSLFVATPSALYVENDGKFRDYHTETTSLLRDSRIVRCLPLTEDTLAIGTVQNGVILLDVDGNVLRILNTATSGLRGNSINGLFADREHGLWLALNNGLARVDISSPATRFSTREGLGEIVPSIQRWNGTLYAATMTGLCRMRTAPEQTPRFEPVAGIQRQVTTLKPTEHGLLAAGADGLYQVTDSAVVQLIAGGPMIDLTVASTDPSIVYAVGRRGLFVLRLDGSQWRQIDHVDSAGQAFESIAQDMQGRLWVTTISDVWSFDFGVTPVRINRFTTAQGVPVGWKQASRIHNSILFATEQGLIYFDSGAQRFLPYTGFGQKFANSSRSIYTLIEDPSGEIWMSGDAYHGVLHRSNVRSYVWDENVLANYGIKELFAFFVDDDKTIWAAGIDGGLVRYKPSSGGAILSFEAILRGVQVVGRERTVSGGDSAFSSGTKLPYAENALHFEFAAPIYGGAADVEFRERLEGLGRDWSPWTSAAEKEYTNLWEGRYAFHVQARDMRGHLSRESVFYFRVVPPWYRRSLAYVAYALLAAALVWLFVKWRLRSIEARNRKLEKVIEQRTEEVRRQRDEIKAQEAETERLLLNILPAPVAHELRSTGAVTPLCCDSITVCFTDFVGFTLSSEQIAPPDLVVALNRYFTEFDRIVERYSLEKIKTIGDSYMFVAGLPQAKASHAIDAVLAALEIVALVERFADTPPGWQIRIGVHSGPVVAGVVGLRKFAFDIWGRTVNYASRHESSGQPNCVNISAQTYELVREFFQCESRGPVLIKEGRHLEMYLVRGVYNELCALPLGEAGYSFAQLYLQRFGVAPPALPDLSQFSVMA